MPRFILVILAGLFSAAIGLYSAAWMYYTDRERQAQLGVVVEFRVHARTIELIQVERGTSAERAGLRRGDAITAVNGRRLTTPNPFSDAVLRGHVGDTVRLTVERPGVTPFDVSAVLDPRPPPGRVPIGLALVAAALHLYPLAFLMVAVVVVFQKPQDRNAWLLALLFAGFIAAAPAEEELVHPALRGFGLGFRVLFAGLGPALFAYLFSVFPVRSPLDRRWPWVKGLLLGVAIVFALPLSVAVAVSSSVVPLELIEDDFDRWSNVIVAYVALCYATGIVSLLWAYWRAPTPETRRRSRVIVWGTVIGFLPMFLLQTIGGWLHRSIYEMFPLWVWAPAVLALFLLPISVGYAVVKYRVLEIPLLLRRSARYLLVQRGFVVLLVMTSLGATFALAAVFSRVFADRADVAIPTGLIVGVLFGATLTWVGSRAERRVTRKLDRAFFRSAYDARQLLEELAVRAQQVTDRSELARILEQSLRNALHPQWLAVYLRAADGDHLEGVCGDLQLSAAAIPLSAPAIRNLTEKGKPLAVPQQEALAVASLAPFDVMRPECLAPMIGRTGQTMGLLAFGPRRSEEPYSGEDRRLLAAVSQQAAGALETIGLAEEMAKRIEEDRRSRQEMEIAMQVQRKLLPQKHPSLPTIDCAAACLQARAVGGDYYDFLDFGSGRLGIVLADISGKGISAALLMANLQANLRSQYALASQDLEGLLVSVDRLFFEATTASHYATLFFGRYDDGTRRLEYANCGHNPPFLIRAAGGVERLDPTAGVVGLFDRWACATRTLCLNPGDLLTIYTDGVIEALSDAGEEFGEERLLATLHRLRDRSASEILQGVVSEVQEFSGASRRTISR